MKNMSCNLWTKRITQLIVVFACLLIFFTTGCGRVAAPNLTAEDRKRDIQYMADWTRNYHPIIELAEKQLNFPSYEELLPRYLEFAEQAETNEEFYQVVRGYFEVIATRRGHFFFVPDETLKLAKIATSLGIVNVGITPGQMERARYWARLSKTIPIYAHPSFHVEKRDNRYFTDDDWKYDGTFFPKGSEILKINGMSCSQYLSHLETNTYLKYVPPSYKEFFKDLLMIIDESPSFKGWQVDFCLPDGSEFTAFVPKIAGFPHLKGRAIPTPKPEANCTCLELTKDVGYVRINLCDSGALANLFSTSGRKDRKKITAFLNRSQGKYSKLIIDIRDNGGGVTQYFYDTLLCPFLDKPVMYSQVAGVKTKYLTDTNKSVQNFLKKGASTKKDHVIRIKKIQPPGLFDPNQWTFYEVVRKVKPSNRYNFKGNLYFLMNGGCFSAADDLVNHVKRIGLATLVGRNTRGGGSAYIGPGYIILPASKIALMVETELVLNLDGSVNELFGISPDIELPIAVPPESITKEDLLKDEWIKQILAIGQDCANQQ